MSEPLNQEDPENERHARIRRVKWLLRYLPRKATLHRYPFLKFFAESARKRAYLWSFRMPEVTPALYAGFILTFIPLYGIQIPCALALALLFRANLMILVGLQLISNPLTIGPIYYVAFKIGQFITSFFISSETAIDQSYVLETGKTLSNFGKKAVVFFREAMIGGAIMGYFSALITSISLKLFASKFSGKK